MGFSASGRLQFQNSLRVLECVKVLAPTTLRKSIFQHFHTFAKRCTFSTFCLLDGIFLKFLVSPGGVGFDINCGVRFLRTNLMEDIKPIQEEAQNLFNHIPVGVGSRGILPTMKGLVGALEMRIDWSIREAMHGLKSC